MTYADQLVNRLVFQSPADDSFSAERPPQADLFVTVSATDYLLLLAIADLANELRHGLVQHFDARDLPTAVVITESELYPLLEDYEARRSVLDVLDGDARAFNAARQ